MGIKDVSTTIKNSNSNVLCEKYASDYYNCIEKTNSLWLPQTAKDILNLVDEEVTTKMFSMRSTTSSVQKQVWVPLHVVKISSQIFHKNREILVSGAMLKNNWQCINNEYYTGQQVLKYDTAISIKANLLSKPLAPLILYSSCEWYCHYTTWCWCDWTN